MLLLLLQLLLLLLPLLLLLLLLLLVSCTYYSGRSDRLYGYLGSSLIENMNNSRCRKMRFTKGRQN